MLEADDKNDKQQEKWAITKRWQSRGEEKADNEG
jgi:hypothetical protein